MRVPTRNRGLEGAETRFAAVVVWQRDIFGDDDPESAFSFALAAGIVVGWSSTSRHGRFRPELVVRCSASPGALSTMIGVQVGVL